MLLRTILVFYFVLLISVVSFSQPELDIKPDKIEFDDFFYRIDNAYLINKGDQLLTIDSLKFRKDFYLIDFEENLQPPFSILPEDSVRITIALSGFYYVTVSDTLDTIKVYNNVIKDPAALKVKIDFFEDEFGSINGNVTDGVNPLDSSYLYFFFEGVYLLDTAITDANGHYSITLPEGDYTIAAEKKGYHITFYNNTFDPFFAKEVELAVDDSLIIDLTLQSIIDTTFSVSGEIFDSTGIFDINRGIVVIRKGKHVPGILNRNNTLAFGEVFAGLIKPDGTYTINMEIPGYYYVQSYTNYFLPGYYNEVGSASVFWTDGDSVLIDNEIINKNVYLLRDSSYGGGRLGGNINFGSLNPGTDYEGISLFVRSLETNALYSYNFGKEAGDYTIANIPFGTYEVVAQKIGFNNGVSQIVTIDSINNQFFNIDVSFLISGVENDDGNIFPSELILHPGYPNPFNPSTNISFSLPNTADIKLQILNILGESISVLLNTRLPGGNYNYNFVANGLSSGVYIVSLQAGNQIRTQKIMLIK
jgi:Secretion system C-terminal sorting domain